MAERLHPGREKDAALCAWGIDLDGKKHLLHLTPGTKEDTESVQGLIQDMKRRGLKDPLLVTGGRSARPICSSGCLKRIVDGPT